MKITFVLYGAMPNGGTRVVAIYALKLLEMGHDVTVVSRAPKEVPLWRRIARQLRGRKTPKIPKNHAVFLDPLEGRHIMIDHDGPPLPEDVPDADVIIATWWRTAFEVALLPPVKGRKVHFIQGYEVFQGGSEDLSSGCYHLPLKKIAVASWLRDLMAERYGDTDVALVPNSVDGLQFHAPTRQKSLRPTVGLVYSSLPAKGIDVGIAAIKKLHDSMPNLHIIAFGSSPPAPGLLPVGAEFHLLPQQDKIRDIYASCDVWLWPSRVEGFGLPLLEAMACRCPIVATRAGAAADLIDHGGNGYLADVDDTDALAVHLRNILSLEPVAWQNMSTAAFLRAHSYTWDDAAKKFAAVLQAD